MDLTKINYLDLISTYGWIRCLIMLLIIVVLLKILRYVANKNQNSIHKIYLTNIVQGFIIFAGIIYMMYQFEATTRFISIILASSGLLVAVLGFAAQESLSNIINGLFITIFKPFEIGNRIKIMSSNITGTIKDITLRHTIINTFNNSTIIVPNSMMNKEIIENFHYEDSRFCGFLDVTVSYTSDIPKAIRIMQDIVSTHALVLDTRTPEEIEQGVPRVKVYARELALNGIALRTSVWTADINDNFSVCSDLRLQLIETYKVNGIEMAYPHYVITQEN